LCYAQFVGAIFSNYPCSFFENLEDLHFFVFSFWVGKVMYSLKNVTKNKVG